MADAEVLVVEGDRIQLACLFPVGHRDLPPLHASNGRSCQAFRHWGTRHNITLTVAPITFCCFEQEAHG